MGDLAGADIVVDPAELELDEASAAELAAASNIVQRNMDILRGFAAREPEGKPRRVVLRFGVSPVAMLGEERVEGVELVHNELVPDGRGSVRAQATDERETLSCELVFRSVGYRGLPCPGLPFDEGSGTMPNEGGRVLGEDGRPLPGVYCAGWIKRGPTGVIGTNKKDATETVEALLADAEAGLIGGTVRPPRPSTRCSPSAGSTPSSTRAGRRSTPRNVPPASRTGGRGSSSRAGRRCSTAARGAEVGRPACGCIGTELAHLSVRHWT